MKNQSRILKNGSKPAAVSQPKTVPSRAPSRPASKSPCIALFQGGLGVIDYGVSDEIINLSEAEYATLKRGAAMAGSGVLMFMANAALKKAGWPPKNITCRFIGTDGSELALVDFPYDVFSRIEAAASKLGITLGRFINNAIRNLNKSQKSWRGA